MMQSCPFIKKATLVGTLLLVEVEKIVCGQDEQTECFYAHA
jgi:hypothetical protein